MSRVSAVLFATRGRGRLDWTDWVSYLYLALGLVVMFGPVLWLVLSSFKTEAGLIEFPPRLLPYEQAHAAASLGACKIINIKLGRVGGHLQAKRIHDLCEKNSIPNWCGGMLESGVGRAHNIAMSTQSNFSLPGDVSASARYWQEDIISPEVIVTPQGTIQVPTGPGIGFTPRRDRIDSVTTRKLHLT